ncbi:MAG: hypothetical protein ACLUD0_05880 [Eubacterium ramulus]
MSSDYKGDPSSAMLEVLAFRAKFKFIDHYVDMPVDLSKCCLFATASADVYVPHRCWIMWN